MDYRNSKQKEVIVDIESGETSHGGDNRSGPVSGNKRGNKSLNKLVSGVIGFKDLSLNTKSDGNSGGLVANAYKTIESFIDRNPEGQHSDQELVPLVGKDRGEDKWRAGKVMKSPKPPRPPRGPSLDASDMRLVKEISRIATKKRERVERMRALKKVKAAKSSPSPSPPPSPSPSPSLPSSSSAASAISGATISALVITLLFFLVIIFQAFGSSYSPSMTFVGAPQPAPQSNDLRFTGTNLELSPTG